MKNIILSGLIVFLLFACGGGVAKKESQKNSVRKEFSLPAIPSVYTTDEDRIRYIAAHYWDNYDFTDTVMIDSVDYTEQIFANYTSVLLSGIDTHKSVNILFDKVIGGGEHAFDAFQELFEKYFYDPNSPMRNEDIYILYLEYVLNSNLLDETQKIRPRRQYEMVLKNMVGQPAADFIYTLSSGRKAQLYGIRSLYTIVFFNNPDCHDCARVQEVMANSPVVARMLAAGKLKILSVYPDEDLTAWRGHEYPAEWINSYDAEHVLMDKRVYDLRAIPTLYLLGEDKTVILKDAQVEEIINWLAQNN